MVSISRYVEEEFLRSDIGTCVSTPRDGMLRAIGVVFPGVTVLIETADTTEGVKGAIEKTPLSFGQSIGTAPISMLLMRVCSIPILNS